MLAGLIERAGMQDLAKSYGAKIIGNSMPPSSSGIGNAKVKRFQERH